MITQDTDDAIRLLAKVIEEVRRTARGPGGFVPTLAELGRPGIRTLKIPLDNARNKEPFPVNGRTLSVVDADSAVSSAQIWFNVQRPEETTGGPLFKGMQYKVDFQGFFLTNTAQPGAFLTILVGEEADFVGINFNLGNLATLDLIKNIDAVTQTPSAYTLKTFFGGSTAGSGTLNGTMYIVPAGKISKLIFTTFSATPFANNDSPRMTWNFSGGGAIDLLDTKGSVGGIPTNYSHSFLPIITLLAGDTLAFNKDDARDSVRINGIVLEQN